MDSERIAMGILLILIGGLTFYFTMKSTLNQFQNLDDFDDLPFLNKTKFFILSQVLFFGGFVLIVVELTN
jgi:hypothetical protein